MDFLILCKMYLGNIIGESTIMLRSTFSTDISIFTLLVGLLVGPVMSTQAADTGLIMAIDERYRAAVLQTFVGSDKTGDAGADE